MSWRFMCPDLEAAARSRQRQKNKHYLVWWSWYESFVKTWPRGKPFPEWLPMGKLPSIDKSERRDINQYGIYEIGDDGLLRVDSMR